MATVADLVPGDLVVSPHRTAVFIAKADHPLRPDMVLVIWHLGERWHLEGLDTRQVAGDVEPSTDEDRAQRVRSALLIGELP